MAEQKKLEALKRERAQLRTSFTNTKKSIENLLQDKDVASRREKLLAQLDLLTLRMEGISDKDAKIAELLYSEDSEVENNVLEEEQNKVDMYQLEFFNCKKLIDNEVVLSMDQSSASSSYQGSRVHKQYKLPMLQLKKFDGTLKDWLPFWSQFNKIDQDPTLPDVDKMGYLSMSMVPGSPAEKLVQSYPATGDMYASVVIALKARFGRKDLLTEFYIRELLKIVIQNTKMKLSVTDLYDKLQCHLRNLNTLGVSAENCASILMPLVSSCLPEHLLQIWERNSVPAVASTEQNPTSKEYLDSLLNFLKVEVEGAQKMELAKSGFGLVSAASTTPAKPTHSLKRDHRYDYKPPEFKSNVPTAAGLVNTPKTEFRDACIFCSGKHLSQDCRKTLTVEQRRMLVREKQVCFCCLKPGCRAVKCRNRPKCGKCSKSHFDLLCPDLDSKTSSGLASMCRNTVLLRTVVVKVKSNTGNNWKYARLIYDSGSQQSYVLSKTTTELGYEPCGIEVIQHALFGGTITKPVKHNIYQLFLCSLDDKFECTLDVYDQTEICSSIPTVPTGPWLGELARKNIHLTDLEYPTTEIEILIGSDFEGKLLTGRREELTSGLVAIETQLGWTLSGKLPTLSGNLESSLATTLVTSMFCKDVSVSDLWSLDVLGINDPLERASKAEMAEETERHFLSTVQVVDGRFEIRLPFKGNHLPISDNYKSAQKRLETTVSKLERDGWRDAYQRVLYDWEERGVVERVPEDEAHLINVYLPHRHVIKLGSTTPVRPVFDASAHEGNKPCLNECLEKGPNLLEKIPSCLARFRQKKIGISSDIEKAFLQISVHKEDRNFLGFLWKDSDNKLITMRHCRVVFGVCSSPFLLEACLHLHLENTLELCKDGSLPYPLEMIKTLRNSFYVDNCLTSVDTMEEASKFIEVASSVMEQRKFILRGWELSGEETGKPSNVLGLLWDKKDDTLSINIENLTSMSVEKVTKKVILSAAHRIFDPIGIVSAFVLIPKILLQQAWESKVSWNEELSEEIAERFCQWLKQVPLISQVKVPRCVAGSNHPNNGWSLHIFCDASKVAYAALVLLRVELEDKVTVQLLSCKSRVAPIGKNKSGMTIPRLELMAATIATRLYRLTVEDFSLSNVKSTFWTDATTVLAWIKRSDPWNVFVTNRVKEIRETTDVSQWRHVPGHENPADLPSRGCMMKKLLENNWWEGPSWLRQSPECWPEGGETASEDEVMREIKKTVVSSMIVSDNTDKDVGWYHNYFSDYNKMIRLVAWVCRFLANCKVLKHERTKGELTAQEFVAAEHKVWLWVQKESFCDKDESKLKSLLPFVDEDGLIRIKTKVSNREDTTDFCFPIVLPDSHPVVERLILSYHRENCHAGIQILLSIIRQRFWILKGRKTVRSVIHKCVPCKRYTTKRLESIPTPLPMNRVRDAKVFEVSGCDLAGPLYVKSDKGTTKVWIVLFTCAVYRAVRLELVSSLSTHSFLEAFSRFCSRNGRCKIMYSDQGSNFTGFDAACEKLDWSAITQYSSARRVEWRFNPPSSPWWGGWWERLIGILKGMLRRVLGHAFLSYESLLTLLSECERVINNRPLTYMSDDATDLAVLTPAMFLHELEETGVPEHDLIHGSVLRRQYKHQRELKVQLRKRFKLEYLGQLKLLSTNKKTHHLKLGDIVFIGDDNCKRADWPLGRVMELIPGVDGEVRVVHVRTQNGILVRPIQRLYPLEFSCNVDNLLPTIQDIPTEVQDIDSSIPPAVVQPGIVHPTNTLDVDVTQPNPIHSTRHGRSIRKPTRLDL